MRVTGRSALVTALATILTVTTSTPSQAATRLEPYVPQTSASAARDFVLTTRHAYWSAVVVVPDRTTAVDFAIANDLTQSDASITFVNHGGRGQTMVWGIDSNYGRMPLGDHVASVTRTTSRGRYRIAFAEGADYVLASRRTTLTNPAGQTALVRDVYLTPGQSLAGWSPPGTRLELLVSENPPKNWRTGSGGGWGPDGWQRDHARYYRNLRLDGASCTLWAVPEAAWYGLLLVSTDDTAARTAAVYPSSVSPQRAWDGGAPVCPSALP